MENKTAVDVEEAKRVAAKTYLTLEEFSAAKNLCLIDHMLRSSKYPEDEESPSGKKFIPMLIVRRVNLLLKESYVKHKLVLQQLLLLENQDWLQFLPLSELHNFYYLKTLCQMKLGLFADAKESHDRALEELEEFDFKPEFVKKRKAKLDTGLQSIIKNGCMNKALQTVEVTPSVGAMLKEVNEKYPTISNKVTFKKYAETNTKASNYNKGLFASVDLMPGEIIVLENPLVNILGSSSSNCCLLNEVCHWCLGNNFNLALPCRNCSLVVFCSLDCRDKALESFHKYECPLGSAYLHKNIMFRIHTSATLRALFSLNVEECKDLLLAAKEMWLQGQSSSSNMPEIQKLVECVSKSFGSKTNALRQLLEFYHSNNPVDDLEIHRQYYTPALVMLKESRLFANIPGYEEDVQPVLEYMTVTCFVMQFRHWRELNMVYKKHQEVRKVTGLAIFPALSLVSHSCLPNAANVTGENGKMFAFTTRAVKSGEEITISYFTETDHFDGDAFERMGILATIYGVRLLCTCLLCSRAWGPRNFAISELRKRKDMKKALSEVALREQKLAEEKIPKSDVDAKLEFWVRESLHWQKKMSAESFSLYCAEFLSARVFSVMCDKYLFRAHQV